jgi:putative SOS response-associated peptidase YedK
VTTKPFFREPFKRKRCLMPVSGYYEWEDTPGGKQPHYFTVRDGSPVLTVAAVSKRVNSSKADKDDATLIEPMKQAA